MVEKSIEKQINLQDKEEILTTLREAFIDENACLRYRITERFHVVLQKLFEQHKQNVTNEAETLIVDKIEESLDTYFEASTKNDYLNVQVAMKQLGINSSDFSEEEKAVLEKCLSKANLTKATNNFKGRSQQHYKKRKHK